MALKFIGSYNIPSWAVCALEYGDESGLREQDLEDIKAWMENEFSGWKSLCYSWDEESEFTHTPEFGLPCKTTRCKVHGHRNKGEF